MTPPDISKYFSQFLSEYNPAEKDALWAVQSQRIRDFLNDRVLSDDPNQISDTECDEIIRLLDRNGKGNTKDSESVARAMVAQGAWRRLFNEFHNNIELGKLVVSILEEKDPDTKIELIDKLYKENEGRNNYLTGPSGNTIGAFLGGYDPVNNLSVISLKDRRKLIDFLGLEVPFDWETATVGTKIVLTNKILYDGIKDAGLDGSARTVSRFCYYDPIRSMWKIKGTVKRMDKDVSVSVPSDEDEVDENSSAESISESMQIQALLAELGTKMGFKIWLPKADRSRVMKAWAPQDNLVEELLFGFDAITMKTIENIDVLWLKGHAIIRAFEVEHTTSVYSGLLRMADLVALQPNISIKLHIVADISRRDKVMQEIKRPVFSLLEGRALSEMCTYLSYDSIKAISELGHLTHMSDMVIEDYEESAETSDTE
jgi:hypothetical protein